MILKSIILCIHILYFITYKDVIMISAFNLEMKKSNNNIILPQIEFTESKRLRQDWISAFQRKRVSLAGIGVSRDTNAREPSELTHAPYTTI